MTISNARTKAHLGGEFFSDPPKKKIESKKKVPAPVIVVGEHGRYLIKSGRLSGNFVARAFPKPPTKVRGLIAEAAGETEESAVAALHEIIDAREKRRVDDRRLDAHAGIAVPSKNEFIEAISQAKLTDTQLAMLKALAISGQDGLTEARIAGSGGYGSWLTAVRSLANAGRLIADYLSIDTSSNTERSDPESTAILGYRGESAKEGDPGNWILHEEMLHAVRASM